MFKVESRHTFHSEASGSLASEWKVCRLSTLNTGNLKLKNTERVLLIAVKISTMPSSLRRSVQHGEILPAETRRCLAMPVHAVMCCIVLCYSWILTDVVCAYVVHPSSHPDRDGSVSPDCYPLVRSDLQIVRDSRYWKEK